MATKPENKLHKEIAAAAATTPLGTGALRFDTQFTVERRAGLRSEALLLKADAITVEDEEEISQNLATTPKTRQELYRSERRIRPLLHRRRAQGPRGGEAAGTSAGRVVASLFALEKKRRERKVGDVPQWSVLYS
jgi:hypothetical protein